MMFSLFSNAPQVMVPLMFVGAFIGTQPVRKALRPPARRPSFISLWRARNAPMTRHAWVVLDDGTAYWFEDVASANYWASHNPAGEPLVVHAATQARAIRVAAVTRADINAIDPNPNRGFTDII